jgi:hypothetical protein
MTQHTAENVSFPQLALMILASGSRSIIDLDFKAGIDFDTPKR